MPQEDLKVTYIHASEYIRVFKCVLSLYIWPIIGPYYWVSKIEPGF